NTIKRRRKLGYVNDAGTNLERVEMTMHVGTHIDALGHATIGERMFGGLRADDVVTDRGLDTLGAEHIPPMITRGLLFDVAGENGREAGQVITINDLEQAAELGKFSVEQGDVAMIRTGWGRYYETDNTKYL